MFYLAAFSKLCTYYLFFSFASCITQSLATVVSHFSCSFEFSFCFSHIYSILSVLDSIHPDQYCTCTPLSLFLEITLQACLKLYNFSFWSLCIPTILLKFVISFQFDLPTSLSTVSQFVWIQYSDPFNTIAALFSVTVRSWSDIPQWKYSSPFVVLKCRRVRNSLGLKCYSTS